MGTRTTPQASTLEMLGYERTTQAGIYRSDYPVCRLMPLISLNDLPNDQHNVLIRLFASKKREIMAATEKIRQQMEYFPEYLINYIRDFITNLLTGGEDMDWLNMTHEDKAAMKKRWLEALCSSFSPEEIMPLFTPEERLKGMKPEELEAYLLRMKREQAGKIPEGE